MDENRDFNPNTPSAEPKNETVNDNGAPFIPNADFTPVQSDAGVSTQPDAAGVPLCDDTVCAPVQPACEPSPDYAAPQPPPQPIYQQMPPQGGYAQPMGQQMPPQGGYAQPMGQQMPPQGGYAQPMYGGYPPYAPYPYPPYPIKQKTPGKGFGIAGMVLGILATLASFDAQVVLGGTLIYAILAVVFGFVSRSKGYKNGISLTALITGFLSVAIAIAAIAHFAWFIYEFGDEYDRRKYNNEFEYYQDYFFDTYEEEYEYDGYDDYGDDYEI